MHKSTPPDLFGHARLAHGYPAITAAVVNTQVPAISYANWFSYEIDFVSQNKEIEQAFTTTCRLYPGYKVRFVGDAGLDDQKMFAQIERLEQEFVFRVSHLERIVEVYNARLDRWETEILQDLTDTVLYQATFQVLFKHAGRTRLDTVKFGWFQIRLPDHRAIHGGCILIAWIQKVGCTLEVPPTRTRNRFGCSLLSFLPPYSITPSLT